MRRPIVDGLGEIASFERTLAGLLLVALTLLTRPVPAQTAAGEAECHSQHGTYVAMETPPASPEAPIAWPEVVRHVRSELLLRRIGLCVTPRAGRPLAKMRLEEQPPTSLRITLLAQDPEELLGERSLDLAPIPSDARLLSITVAADELLAANFSELERRAARARAARQAQPAAPPPPRVPDEPRRELGPGFVYESFDGGQTLLGVEARFGVDVVGPLGLTARVGFRQALPQQADHGSIHGNAWLGGVGLRLQLVESDRLKLDVLGRIDALRLSASAFAEEGATARSDAGLAVLLGAGPSVRVLLSRSLRLMLDASAGAPARPVHLTDTGRRVSGISGLALSLGGGVLVAF